MNAGVFLFSDQSTYLFILLLFIYFPQIQLYYNTIILQYNFNIYY